jgi:hypothetical protein
LRKRSSHGAQSHLEFAISCKSQWAIHPTAGIIGEAASMLSRTRASLAPAQPVIRILDRVEPLATLAAKR